MADYNKATNFTAKDTLPTGNAGKIVKGAEIDTELSAISNAIASKADINSPSFTGTPVAPTASAGTNTTQLATTAFVTAALSAAYPVGSIYINAASASNPSTLLGFGTWVAFGSGRVMVGLDASDAMFDTVEETGGSATVVPSGSISGTSGSTSLTEAQMPKHYHTLWGPSAISGFVQAPVNSAGVFNGGTPDDGAQTYGSYSVGGDASSGGFGTGTSVGNGHTHSSGSLAFTGTSQSNIQPYITVRMWKRTA